MQDKFKNTCLHLLLKKNKNSLEILKLLVENKINLNLKDWNLNTPIHVACSQTKKDILFFMIEKKSNPYLLNKKKENILHILCSNANLNVDILEYVMSLNSEINQADEKKETPLHKLTTQNLNLDLIAYLINYKADLNLNFPENPLSYALKNTKCTIEVIEFLVKSKSQVDKIFFSSILE